MRERCGELPAPGLHIESVLMVDMQEWKKQYPRYLSYPPAGPSFYAHVFHPAFNLDSDDASEAVDRFVTHTKAVGNGVQDLRSTFGKVREASIGRAFPQPFDYCFFLTKFGL